jgi:hypothetical protein
MKPISLTPLTKEVKIEYSHKPLHLSSERKTEIENYWLKVNQNARFHRGEVFSVDTITEDEGFFKVSLKATDYAHYLHTVRNHITDEEGCKVIYGAGLVETKDSYFIFIFGEMAEHTAYPGRLQCVGGGLSNEDKSGQSFDIKQSVLRELSEELGISSQGVEYCTPRFFKTGGPYDFMVVLFHNQLRLSYDQMSNQYHTYIKDLIDDGNKPEFKEIIHIKNDKQSIIDFWSVDNRPSVDYLKPLLEKMVKSF